MHHGFFFLGRIGHFADAFVHGLHVRVRAPFGTFVCGRRIGGDGWDNERCGAR